MGGAGAGVAAGEEAGVEEEAGELKSCSGRGRGGGESCSTSACTQPARRLGLVASPWADVFLLRASLAAPFTLSKSSPYSCASLGPSLTRAVTQNSSLPRQPTPIKCHLATSCC